MRDLVPDFRPEHVMADFEEASVGAFQEVFAGVAVSGYWFHYCQAVVKRLNKLGLKEDYQNQDDIKDIVRCLFGLPLLPAEDIRNALQTIRAMICTDMRMARQLQQLMTYVQRQWIDRWRTNNVLESYHAALSRRIQVSITVKQICEYLAKI